MKRYNVIGIDSRFDESPDGNWVEYPDHAAEIERLKALMLEAVTTLCIPNPTAEQQMHMVHRLREAAK